MESKKETRGRKRIPEGMHKAPQSTMKINEIIVPFVSLLKSNLKIGLVNEKIIQKLFNVLDGSSNEEQLDAVDLINSSPETKFQCCFLKNNGVKCTNKAWHETKFHGAVVMSCNLHYKTKINIEYEKQLKKGNF